MADWFPMGVREDIAKTVRLKPHRDVRYTSPTVELYTPKGGSLATPTGTLDSVSTTVASATDGSTMVLTSATNVAANRFYLLTHEGQTYSLEVRSLTGSEGITLKDELPFTPTAGDTFVGLEVSFTLTATHNADRGRTYRIFLRDTDNADVESVYDYDVVRHPFMSPLTGADVRRVVQRRWGSFKLEEGEAEDYAEQVHRRLVMRIRDLELYADLFFSPSTWMEPAERCLDVILAEASMVPSGHDPERWLETAREEFNYALGRASRASKPGYDSDDDDAPEDEQTGSGARQVRHVR